MTICRHCKTQIERWGNGWSHSTMHDNRFDHEASPEPTPVTVPGEQRGNMSCAHEFVAVEIFYSVCKKCGQSESEVEQSPQPVDSNEVVTKRNQLEAQPLPAATQLEVDLHNPHPDEKFDAYRAALLEDYELLLSKYRALEAELSRLTSLAHSKPVESNGSGFNEGVEAASVRICYACSNHLIDPERDPVAIMEGGRWVHVFSEKMTVPCVANNIRKLKRPILNTEATHVKP